MVIKIKPSILRLTSLSTLLSKWPYRERATPLKKKKWPLANKQQEARNFSLTILSELNIDTI